MSAATSQPPSLAAHLVRDHALRCEWWAEQVGIHGLAGAVKAYRKRLPRQLAELASVMPDLHDAWTCGLVRGVWAVG